MAVPSFKEDHISATIIRWVSCTPKGKVILNPTLIKAPKGSIEYVIIHELCHLVHHNHTRAFYALQETIMPDWKERLEHSLVQKGLLNK
ncbi:M48 family metallopeptidase [Algoriphagus aquimarinus]|uniref:M48 metallopeptidase family protein n=1 Tax=Algoriphagus aquimarinus TaxID=237018 RepID=UPI001CB890B0|nr:M48 family metallopeptidase [Algoriphagus aquimarinus]